MIGYKVQLRFAKAILKLIIENNQDADEILKELVFFSDIIKNKELISLFKYPQIDYERKESLLLELISKFEFTALTKKILVYLLKIGILEDLNNIIKILKELIDDLKKRIEVEVFLRYPLTKEQKEKLITNLQEKLKKEVILNFNYKQNLIGGIILRIKDKLIDGSVNHYLQSLKQKIILS
jgi:F-type H+-transporting ATPase subunit delta